VKKTYLLFLSFLFVVQSASYGAEPFQLQSELRTKFTGGTSSFTNYGYDALGNRTSKRVFDGIDSLSALLSRLNYVYDAQGNVSLELLLGPGGDTLSIVSYTYAAGDMTSASTLRKDGSLRYKDSLLYAGGLCVEQRRYNSTLAMTFYHRYAFTGGLLTADSLYESDGAGGFSASQALLLVRNADSTVNAESKWLKTSGLWYCTSTTLMGYLQKMLVSTTKYENDGTTKRLIDSLSYTNDSFGNRIKETNFDADRVKIYDVAYTWNDMQSGVVWQKVSSQATLRMAYSNGHIEFGAKTSGTIAMCRADGRRMYERTFDGESGIALPGGIAAGRYVVMIRGNRNGSLPITIYN
jgi:YD repeat-containing protein